MILLCRYCCPCRYSGIHYVIVYCVDSQVAESFVNPFGEDDDDFDMNFLIDRNLQVFYWRFDASSGLKKDYWTLCYYRIYRPMFITIPYTITVL